MYQKISGVKLKAFRLACQMEMREFASACDVPVATVQTWEQQGRHRFYPVSILTSFLCREPMYVCLLEKMGYEIPALDQGSNT